MNGCIQAFSGESEDGIYVTNLFVPNLFVLKELMRLKNQSVVH